MPIKNIVFDMGNVLVVDDVPAYVGQTVPDKDDCALVMRELVYGPEWKEWDCGAISIEQAAESAAARLPEHLRGACAPLMQNWHMDIKPVRGMEPLILRLKMAGYGIYLLSNTATSYYRYRRSLPAIGCFNGEFISADCGLLKPDRAIYDTFTSRYNLRPEECFFVDDLAQNVQGAKDAGWQGYVFFGDAMALEAALKAAGVEPVALK